ncbi:hypothetical protein NYR60_02615 [Actinobacillus genomosp. 2]|uniref:hypothetical protein n=1 Tax=Actinobacillus genomosp. 2 TaxID=230709 RepID=UPI002441EF65|nr:hypothetical protein [Actinobacillus genomosp. 2]WGE32523.1 hypothetical protein NYR60_02615 [Actinobacillus genomosp. 2]
MSKVGDIIIGVSVFILFPAVGYFFYSIFPQFDFFIWFLFSFVSTGLITAFIMPLFGFIVPFVDD